MSLRLFVIIVVLLYGHLTSATELRCRCLMSNATCWPSPSVWQTLNQSVDGRLLSVRPTAAFCSGNPIDWNACNTTFYQWTNATWRGDQVGAMQNPNWENSACTGDLGNLVCTQGSVPRLAVDARTPEHVQTTIRFASAHNLRLVMKTTGHDYLGRSTAPDSLLLWLHNMKTISLIEPYSTCTGESVANAVRVTAGVQWGEVYAWLSKHNLVVIGGASGTVGAAGGYLQGGGHGPLTRWKGMAADQILEFDVVTADGQRRTVNACTDKDLFWALCGGGGGTFGVVLSVTLRTYPSPSISSVLYVVATDNEPRYARFIQDFTRFLPTLADANWSGYFYITDTFISIAFFVPNGNFAADIALFNQLMKNNSDLIFVRNETFFYPTFYEFYKGMMAESNPTGGNVLLGSRLIPESIVRNRPDELADVFIQTKGRTENETVLIGHLVAGGRVSTISVDNSVNPAWRQALLHMIHVQGWPDETSPAEQNLLAARLRTRVDLLQTMAGGSQSGCYMNEADPNEPNWQQKFFGSQTIYNRLKSIKRTVDPNGLFVCKNCVGSEDWTADLNCPLKSSASRAPLTFLLLLLLLFIKRL